MDGEVIEEPEIPKERWIPLDAIDSGLSVDANEYEMAGNESCFDVYSGKYIDLPDYEAYRMFILKVKKISRRLKEPDVIEDKQSNTQK